MEESLRATCADGLKMSANIFDTGSPAHRLTGIELLKGGTFVDAFMTAPILLHLQKSALI